MAFRPKFSAVIFDLDGVITKTALVHAAAWKKMFDEYLQSREKRFSEPFREFTHSEDYLPYVDGKPRYKGVASFLDSRGIDIPFGDPSDDPGKETVCGLGNRKNVMFRKVLDEEGVEVYESTVELLHQLKESGVRLGVASSSKNCKPVLEKAGLLDLFETRVDGVVSAEIGLQGKPEPDIFTTACDNLGVPYHRSVVVEDAVSGVQAGRNGNFGLVLGVARENNKRELRVGGADIVVEDLGEIGIQGINDWFESGIENEGWQLRFHTYDQEMERSREALLTVGNGYFGTRGAMEESSANKVNYPGTYVTGLFNRLVSEVAGKEIENEDFVNVINWLPVTFRIGEGPWFGFTPDPVFAIKSIERILDYRKGTMRRILDVEDDRGRLTRIESTRFAGMHDPHVAGLRYAVTPLNYDGRIEIRSELRGDHKNAGVERYNSLNQEHLAPVSEEMAGGRMKLVVKTTRSDVVIAASASHRMKGVSGKAASETSTGSGWIRQTFPVDASREKEVVLEKLVSLYTSQDPGVKDPEADSDKRTGKSAGFEEELGRSEDSWEKIWSKIDIRIGGDRDAQRLVRMHLFHMMVTASPHHAKFDSGIPPRGLHGEAYRGHIFWDELYMVPLYLIHFPEIVRSTLMYRHRRLDEARSYAREYGYQGAMFPWQSGSDGREETQVIHLNPLSGEWGDDYSSLQRHISLAIAFNLISYYHATSDLAFMDHHGAELLLDICVFWASKAEFDETDGKYHIHKVMGPDEFHEKYPGADGGGLTDNAYTNIMVSWMMEKALGIIGELTTGHRKRVLKKISVTDTGLEEWKRISRNLALHISGDGVVEQFRGYFDLEELDWDRYRSEYGDIHRMDRILKAEGKSPDAFKVSKQADFLMAFYNLGAGEVIRIIRKLGYEAGDDLLKANFDYYIERTSHGSTLSRLVHARLAWEMGDRKRGWELYLEALRSDLVDIQGGTTGEGIHCGVMAGTAWDVLSNFGGLVLRGNVPGLHPALPDGWTGLGFGFLFRGIRFNVELSDGTCKISTENAGKQKIKVHICGENIELTQDEPVSVRYHT